MARLDHHVSLRTADMDAAIRFWQHALGARLAVAPVPRSGGYFDRLWGPGITAKIAHLVFDDSTRSLPMVILLTRDIVKGATVTALTRSIDPAIVPVAPLPDAIPLAPTLPTPVQP